jgi:hypothetical protein
MDNGNNLLFIATNSFSSSTRVSEIGCPVIRVICLALTAADKSTPPTRRLSELSTGQLDILEHETIKYTPNDLLLLFIKDLLVMGNQYFWWASKILGPGNWLPRDK